MSIEVSLDLLNDSPYDGSNGELFFFNRTEINSLVSDILKGHPTCYLVSGYRGAGKSSFIIRAETVLMARQNEMLDKLKNELIARDKGIWRVKLQDWLLSIFKKKYRTTSSDIILLTSPYKIFIHTNFAKYESETNLLRKLIRGLYYNIEKDETIVKYIEEYDRKQLEIKHKVFPELKMLFDRTFQEVIETSSNSKEKKTTKEISIDTRKIAMILIKCIGSVTLTIATFLLRKYAWGNLSWIIDVIGYGFATILFFRGIVEWKNTIAYINQEKEEFNRKTLYDNEIADHHFTSVLRKLKELKLEFVFVFDELDKVEDADIDKLINEMKPHLVSGLASYIVVAGQSLYYKYHFAKSSDDAILSSLFSRIIHVPLLEPQEFTNQFRKIAGIPKSDDIKELKPYIDYLIFKSKRVPRRFINLIRQSIVWEDIPNREEDKPIIEYKKEIEKFSDRYTKVLEIISNINKDEIVGNYEESAIRDYLYMQLFIIAEKILLDEKKQTPPQIIT